MHQYSNEVLVSVLLPISKLDRFFESALESILLQTHVAMEVLVLVNGVEDDEFAKISKICEIDSRISVHRIRLRGLVFALNFGIELARGDFIARMDADDLCMSDRFTSQVRFLLDNPSYGVVGGKVLLIDEHNSILDQSFKFYETSSAINKVLPYRNPLCHPALMFTRDSLYAVAGYKYGFMSEDHEMFIRMMLHGIKFHNLDSNVLMYRRHQGQITNISRSKKHFSEISGFMWMHFYNTKNLKFLVGALAVLPVLRRARKLISTIIMRVTKN